MTERKPEILASREVLLERQLELARQFYATDSNSSDSREKHREITEEMTKNAIDLALPEWIEQIKSGATKIAMVAPLRGGLGMVNLATEKHLRDRLEALGYGGVEVEKWAIGVKRNAVKESAEVYFRQGYLDGKNGDYKKTIVSFFDWGCATGATIVDCANEVKSFTGIGMQRMSVVVMTVSEKAQNRIAQDCSDETGSVNVFGSTKARINSVGYVDAVSEINMGSPEFDVTPKDWGDEMWGRFDEGELVERGKNIDFFVEFFGLNFGLKSDWIGEEIMRELTEKYSEKYIGNGANY